MLQADRTGSSNAAKAIDGRASSLREFGRRPRRYPPTPGPKTFCMLVMDMPRCWLAYQLLLNLPAEGDSLRLVHVYEDAPEKVGPAQDLKAKYEAFLKDKSTKFEVTFELIAKPRGAKTSATIQEKMDEFEGRAGISFLIMAPAMPEKSSNADLVRESRRKTVRTGRSVSAGGRPSTSPSRRTRGSTSVPCRTTSSKTTRAI